MIAHREDIDALRGLSVLLVVAFHAFPHLIPGGFIGVDVFFVISGFLITSIIIAEINANQFSLANFYARRIKRLFPALFTVLLFSLVLGWLILFQDEYKQLGYHIFRSSIFLQNFTLIKELGYFDVGSHYKPLLHLWTLSIEEQYYLIWPFIVLALIWLKVRLEVVLIFIILFSFTLNLYFVGNYKDTVFFHFITRCWELGIGSLLAVIISQKPHFLSFKSTKVQTMLFALGMGLILGASFALNEKSLYPYWYGLLPTLGAICVLIAQANFKHWLGLKQVGFISYPLYLWHWVILSFLSIYLGHQASVIVLLSAIALSFLLSYLTYRFIEPIRYNKSSIVTWGLLTLAIMTALAGRLVYTKEGLPTRSNLSYLKAYNLQFERTPATDELCTRYQQEFQHESRLFDYCRANFISQSTKPRVAIIGDSHAHVLYPGVASMASRYGLDTILMANSSCPPLIGFPWGETAKDRVKCQAKIQQILTTLQKDRKIHTVIMATRGPVYLHNEVETPFNLINVNKSLKNHYNKELTYQNYFNGFKKTLIKINKMSHIKKVIYFQENPELDFLPKSLIKRPFEIVNLREKEDFVPQELYTLRMNSYQNQLKNVQMQQPFLTLIDVAPYFCIKNKCHAFLGNQSLYADKDHLSVFGSHYLVEKTHHLLFNDKALKASY